MAKVSLTLLRNELATNVIHHRTILRFVGALGCRWSMKTLKKGLTAGGALAPIGAAAERLVIGNATALLYVPVRIGPDNGSCPFRI